MRLLTVFAFALTLVSVRPALAVEGPAQKSLLETNDFTWIKSHVGRIFDQSLSPRFQSFLERELPTKWPDLGYTEKGSKPTVQDVTRTVFAGPTEPMTGRGNRAYYWACRAHSCSHKGFLWIDADAKKAVASVVHYQLDGKTFTNPQLLVATKNDSCATLPKELARDIKIWLTNVKVKPETARCLDASGSVKSLKL